MASSLHVLLTYRCPLRCTHCYVYGSPRAAGTFTAGQVSNLLAQAARLQSIRWIIFEGGEPFSVFPLLLRSIRQARNLGFDVGVITNGYFARGEATAQNFLRPLQLLDVAALLISDDKFHYRSESNSPARHAFHVAVSLGIPVYRICLQGSTNGANREQDPLSGNLTISPHLKIIGRAAETFVSDQVEKPWEAFTRCPLEDLDQPERVYIDAYGNVQVCQGITIGNAWETSIHELLASLQHEHHPVWRLLIEGGPALLAEAYQIEHTRDYIDACHLCFMVRRRLVDQYPHLLAPRQVYGI